jgi:hypothetical protein
MRVLGASPCGPANAVCSLGFPSNVLPSSARSHRDLPARPMCRGGDHCSVTTGCLDAGHIDDETRELWVEVHLRDGTRGCDDLVPSRGQADV